MTWQGFLQFFIFLSMVLMLASPLGLYMHKVYDRKKTLPDFILLPLERFIYRFCHIDYEAEQHWSSYAVSLLIFSLLSILLVLILLLLQEYLPLNPDKAPHLPFLTALNTAISVVTNTGWKSYIPEKNLSHLTRIVVITVQCFLSGGVAMAAAVALVRGLVRSESLAIGNFWVDLTRSVLWVLLPLCLISAVILLWSGVPQNFSGAAPATTLENIGQKIAEGPVASQVAVKLASSSGAGFFAASSAHPYENPNSFSNFIELVLMLLLPAAMVRFYGRQAGDSTKGTALLVVMCTLFTALFFVAYWAENQHNPLIENVSMDQVVSDDNIGGNMEGKEVRFGTAGSALWMVVANSTANAATVSSYDSMTPLGNLVSLMDLMMNETVFGAAGSGLYKILVFVVITAFIANLLTGKAPEYLGKKIDPHEVSWLVLALLLGPLTMLGFTVLTLFAPDIMRLISNPGPHGLMQVAYNYGSVAENNGSAFAGFNAATNWNNLMTGLSMLVSRYFLIICILGFAGSFAMKKRAVASVRAFSTNSPTFVILLLLMLITCTILAFLPVLIMGPLAEYISIIGKKSF